MRTGRPRQPLRERIADKYVVDLATGCWIWTANTNAQGYGLIQEGGLNGGRVLRAHRAMYELRVGPIPEGMTLDHTCHTNALPDCVDGAGCPHRRCVNPAHLEPVTRGENVRRGEPAQRTHCPQNHPYDAENTYVNPHTGGRSCRICTRAANRRRYDAAREKAA